MTELNNFMSAFEGLSSIYEEESKQAELRRRSRSRRPRIITESKLREKAEETKDLVEVEEPVETEENPIAPIEDTAAESIPSQVVLECANCGALSIKSLDDINSSDDSDLVNIEEECSFCEAAEGYKVIGDFIPKAEQTAEASEEVEEENEEIIEDSEDEIEIEDDEVIE